MRGAVLHESVPDGRILVAVLTLATYILAGFAILQVGAHLHDIWLLLRLKDIRGICF